MTDPQAAYNPPMPQQGVNPLGGTMAADMGAFAAAFPMGAPPPPAAGAPPPGQGGFGVAPNQGMGAQTTAVPAMGDYPQGAPGNYGQAQPSPVNPYGAPPPGYNDPQAYAQQQQPQQPYGQQPPQQPQAPYGQAQQQPYGQAPGGYGGAPPDMQQQYGQQQPYGQQPQPMAPYGQQPGPGMLGPQGMVGTLQSAGNPTGPTKRNALMTFLLPVIVMVGGSVVCGILASLITPFFALLGNLFVLAGFVMFVLYAIKMVNELKAVTRNNAFAWWPILVPFYNYYWLWFMVPAEVARAKQMAGVQAPPRGIVVYVFLWAFAFASDLNDMAR
jgi:hypothetical protein